jgi:antiphage defense system Thoeris ThsA-like protein
MSWNIPFRGGGQKTPLVVGSNTTFDTEVSPRLISPSSIQGQFTEKYYADAKQLDIELQNNLNTLSYEKLDGVRAGKKKRYEIGTVVKVMPRGKTAYFVAMAHMNEHGNAYGEFEYVKDALAKLWVFIGERGDKGQVVMPVLGTGFMRLRVTREEVVREIIQSFVAACAERVFCENLTIVLSPDDVIKHSIDINKIGAFIAHVCEYTEYSPTRINQRGEGIN